MTSVLLQPGTDGLDAASFAKVRDFTAVAAAGYDWLSLYLGGTYGVGTATIEAAWAAGLPIMWNYERDPKAGLGGAVAGRAAAITALHQGRDLGFDGDAAITFSLVDFGPTAVQLPTILDAHHALVDLLGPEAWIGGSYGPKIVLERLVQQSWWPDDWPLWHWGGDGFTRYDWAWAKQWFGAKPAELPAPLDRLHSRAAIGYATDENTLLKPMRFWSGYGTDRDVDPTEDEMEFAIYQCSDADAAFLGLSNANGIVPWVEWLSGSRKAQYAADGLPEKPTSVAGLANCTLIGAIPQGDSRHVWSKTDFAQISTGGPHGTFPATVTIT